MSLSTYRLESAVSVKHRNPAWLATDKVSAVSLSRTVSIWSRIVETFMAMLNPVGKWSNYVMVQFVIRLTSSTLAWPIDASVLGRPYACTLLGQHFPNRFVACCGETELGYQCVLRAAYTANIRAPTMPSNA